MVGIDLDDKQTWISSWPSSHHLTRWVLSFTFFAVFAVWIANFIMVAQTHMWWKVHASLGCAIWYKTRAVHTFIEQVRDP